MAVISSVSTYIIPFVVMFVVIYGLIKKVDVYEEFINGAYDGLKVVVKVAPTLIGLFVAVRILNDSGALNLFTRLLMPAAELIHTPASVIPVIITKLFSSGSAASLMLNLFDIYGPDSLEGLTAAIILSSTESLFYTASVFLMAAGVKKSRYIIPYALISILAGVIASILIANYLVA